MIFITGDTRSKELVKILQRYGIGRMIIDSPIKPYEGEPWAFDNGAFRDWKSGRKFNPDAFLRRLDRAYRIGIPYLAVAPDIVCGGERSLEFSLGWLERLPAEWPWFLAVQDGMKIGDVEKVIHLFDGIFLGGSDCFKWTAWHWCNLAHKHGRKFHFGRAGTARKISFARKIGADSCDSAFPLWVAGRFRRFLDTWESGFEQLELWPPQVWSLRP